MSFILDALKKSETDRQRQTGPALFEVKVAPPKAGFPVWAIAIVVLLAINMVIVGWLLLRRPSKSEEAAQLPIASQQTPTPPPSAATSRAAPTNTAPPPVQNNGAPPQGQSPPSVQEGAPPPTAPASANASGAQTEDQMAGRRIPERDQNEPTLASGAGRASGTGANALNEKSGGGDGAQGSGSQGRTGANASVGPDPGATSGGANPDDFAPAQDPGSPLFKGHVRRGTESGLMLYQDLAVTNGANLPELRLDMHVYDPKPQARFALINMQKVTEGQMMKGDVKVEAITPEGVVMSHNGTKFLLPRE
jgi:general secretion pathway protein B